MTKITRFHEDVFYEYFRPFRHPDAEFDDIWGGYGLETYGNDISLVRTHPREHVWTVVEGSKDEWIVPGLHFVNRVFYLLTQLPHNGPSIEFRISQSPQSLSPLALSRRIRTLRKVLAET